MVTDPDAVLALLKDSSLESRQLADHTGTPREEAARAARVVMGIARAKPEDVVSLPAVLALAALRAALPAGRADVFAAAAAHPNKEVAKEGKRGLHVLKSRGVAVPEPSRPTPAPVAAPAEPPLPCYASTIDGHGERAVWIARNVPGKGIEVAQAVVSDVTGIVELQVGTLGRKEFRAFGKDLGERGRNMGIVEIDRERAKSLVADARRRNDASGRPPPAGADAWLARSGPAAPLEDPALRFPALAEAEERAAIDASAKLHDLPLLRGWLADEPVLREVARKLEEVAVSPIYVDEQQRYEAVLRTLADAVAAFFDPERRARWSARLFTAAAHLADSGDDAHARVAAAAARALRDGEPASRVPFARLLVEKAFPIAPPGGAAAAAPAQAAPPDAPLIVAPR